MPPERRAELMSLGDVFHARVVDLGPDELIFEVLGKPEELESFEELVRPHGIKELVRTGPVGLPRASVPRGSARLTIHVSEPHDRERNQRWRRSSEKATSPCSPARWP